MVRLTRFQLPLATPQLKAFWSDGKLSFFFNAAGTPPRRAQLNSTPGFPGTDQEVTIAEMSEATPNPYLSRFTNKMKVVHRPDSCEEYLAVHLLYLYDLRSFLSAEN